MQIGFALAIVGHSGHEPMSEKALQERIDEYGTMILRISYAYLRDRQKAEDICQEVYIKLFYAGKEFASKVHEKFWLIRVTVNLCKDYRKSAWAKRITSDEKQGEKADWSAEPSLVCEEQEEAQKLFLMVGELPDPFKTVIILYYYEDLSTKEIAQTLNIPEPTVRSRLKRARAKLQKRLEKEG